MGKIALGETPSSGASFSEDMNSLLRPNLVSNKILVPHYLEETYWWAYLHPKGVRFFERQWLVNLILWGNFAKLRDAAIQELGRPVAGKTLQVACVYGDFSRKLVENMTPESTLDLVDVAPVQLENFCRKLQGVCNVTPHHQDSTRLSFQDGEFDQVVVFFLLHEQPTEARLRSVQEALRVTRPGGKTVFVDYHRPHWANPFRYIMFPILHTLEPFAMDLWHHEITDWLAPGCAVQEVKKETFFGGLYQKVVFQR